ncbi:MAG: hypothetical protein IKU52_08815 [Clostridia bacterium]|nr:hypothetical protein [Clostridia bacterium]
MKNKEIRFKIFTFDRNRLIISSVYLFISLSLLTAFGWVPKEYKYTRQFLVVFGFVFLVVFIYSLRKILTKESKLELYRRIGNAFMNFITKITVINQKIRKALGLKERNRLYSDDEKRIIIKDEHKRNRKKKDMITQKKFSSLDDNRERVRFIYAAYIKAQRKKGDSASHDQTPLEIKKHAAKTETEGRLFDLYTPVRYSENFSPTPDEIKEQYDYFSHKIKLK